MTAGPRRRRLPAAERRETILRAASAVFAESGYRAAKVSEVAARVGVTEPVIFQNFGSKAALFAAVIERAAAEVRTALDALPATGDPATGDPMTGDPATGLLAHVLAGGAHGPAAHHQSPGHQPPGHQSSDQQPLDHGLVDHGPLDHGPLDHGPGADTGPAGLPNAGAAYAVLFSDATELAADPEAAGPARDALRALAAHLADVIRHDGGTRPGPDPGPDPEAAAWLLLSVLATRRLRAAAMPPHLEPDVIALLRSALAPPSEPG
jgi:AcrR family transcriptional regulator